MSRQDLNCDKSVEFEAIVFDKDGTLIDFKHTWLPVYQQAALECADNNAQLADALLGEHGYDHASERFIGGSLLAAGNNHDIALAWSRQLANPVDSQRLNQIFQQAVAESVSAVHGLKDTITSLKQNGLKLGIATSDSYDGIHNTLESFEVLPHFDFLCGYDSGHGVKPGAGMVHAFCESVAVLPEQTIVVGDNKHDIEMGRNAGAGLCIGVLTGTSTRNELEAIADEVYDNISGLLDLLTNHG